MSRVGLHLRLDDSLVSVAQQAIALSLPFFQSFIVRRVGKKFIWPTAQEEKQFALVCKQHFKVLFAHGSFWINLSHTQYDNAYALGREVACSRRLGFTHLVVHAGCATGSTDRMKGIDALVRTINTVMRYERHVTLVLENTAHSKLSIGSNISDFALVRQKLAQPEKVKFCIDTAHAYSYGYLLESAQQLQAFVSYLDEMLDINNVALIHLNDTEDTHGSCMDRHALLGAGNIGIPILKQFIEHERLKNIPIILEPPIAPFDHIIQSLDVVRQWHMNM